jgi:hypothetical protein
MARIGSDERQSVNERSRCDYDIAIANGYADFLAFRPDGSRTVKHSKIHRD